MSPTLGILNDYSPYKNFQNTVKFRKIRKFKTARRPVKTKNQKVLLGNLSFIENSACNLTCKHSSSDRDYDKR